MPQQFLEYDSDNPTKYDADALRKKYERAKPWGLSTHIDLGDCNAEAIRDKGKIAQFVIELCDIINMKRYPPDEDPIIVRFGEDPVVTGYTMVQLIETSDMTAHFAENENGTYLCVFSCKYYDPLIAAEFAQVFFQADAGFTFVSLTRKARSRR